MTATRAASSTRGYHHGDLRQALVDAGIELAREEGPRGVVVREAARRVGVSHNAAYRHFADRDSLVLAIAQHAMEQLTVAMQRRMAAVDRRRFTGTPQERAVARATQRVRATGRGYVDFAIEEPGMFRLLFAAFPDQPDIGDPRSPDAATPLDVLTEALDELAEAGGLAPHRRPVAEVLCWSMVHGFATLYLDGPLRDTPAKERDRELERVIDAIEDALSR